MNLRSGFFAGQTNENSLYHRRNSIKYNAFFSSSSKCVYYEIDRKLMMTNTKIKRNLFTQLVKNDYVWGVAKPEYLLEIIFGDTKLINREAAIYNRANSIITLNHKSHGICLKYSYKKLVL